ncbi:MAG TPA: toll/interleukin-1 receptor domain-containing protein [Desulfobacterales bacterium]
MKYNAFISYSHAVDGKLVPAIQNTLHRLAKPIFKLRALKVFRDQTDLSVSPHLWSDIEAALSDSKYLILMASPEAANSKWVRRELEYWLLHKGRESLLIAVTDGDVVWDDSVADFDWQKTTALPEMLANVFDAEPLYADFREFKTKKEVSYTNDEFRNTVAAIAAKLHGVSISDLLGEEIKIHRKVIRIRNTVIASLLLLFVLTAIFAVDAYRGRIRTEKQLIANLVNQGKREVEIGNIYQGVGYYERANQVSRASFDVKRKTMNLSAAWKRSLMLPGDFLDLNYFLGDRSHHMLHHTGKTPVSPITFFKFPDEIVFWRPGRSPEVRKSGRQLTGIPYLFNANQHRLVEVLLDHDSPKVQLWSTHPDLELIRTYAWGRPISYLFMDDDCRYMVLLDTDTYAMAVYSLQSGEKLLDRKYREKIFVVNFASERLLIGFVSGFLEIIDLNGSPAKMTSRRIGPMGKGINNLFVNKDQSFSLVVAEQKTILLDMVSGIEYSINLNALVTSAAFTTDGKHLFIADEEGHLFVYDITRQPALTSVQKYASKIDLIAVHPADNLIALALADGTLRVDEFPSWQTISGNIRFPETKNYFYIGFADNGLYCLDKDFGCMFWVLPHCRTPAGQRHPTSVFVPGRNEVISAVEGKGLFIASLDLPRQSEAIHYDFAHPLAIELTPDKRLAVVTTISNQLVLFDLDRKEVLLDPETNGWVHTVDFNPDRSDLMIGTDKGELAMYNYNSSEPWFSYKFKNRRILDSCFSSQGEYFSISLDNGDNQVYATESGTLIANANHFPVNRCLAVSHRTEYKPSFGKFSPLGSFYLSTGNDGRLLVYNLKSKPSGKLSPEYEIAGDLPVYCAKWSEDERSIVFGTVEGHLYRYRLRDGIDPRFRLKLHDAPSQFFEVPEAGVMLIASLDGKLWTCDAESGIPLGLPYCFGSPPQIWRFDPESGSCVIFSEKSGILKVDVLPPDLPDLQSLIGLSIDEGNTPQMISYTELPVLTDSSSTTKHENISTFPFDPKLLSKPRFKDGSALSGNWTGVGEDIHLANWRFSLQLQVYEDNSVKGIFEWIEVMADGTEQPAGKENTVGYYDPDENMLHMSSIGVESTYGLGGFVWYKAHVSAGMDALKNGNWGRRGHFWGLFSGQKVEADR